MNKITLINLTPYQVNMLEKMWSLDTFEEFTEWQDILDNEDRLLSIELARALLDATEPSDASEEIIDCTEANAVLAKFRL
jgi:hypothetical protein